MFNPEEVMTSDIGGNFKPAPAGNHQARLCSIVSLGTADHTFPNKSGQMITKHMKKIQLGFELLGTSHVFKEEKGPEPYVVYLELTDTMNSQGNFRALLKDWLGRSMTDEEAKVFNLVKLLGNPAEVGTGAKCMVNVVHEPRKGEDGKVIPNAVWANVGSVTQVTIDPATGKPGDVPKGKVPQQLFNFNTPFKKDVFKTLPDKIQKKIQASDEYLALVGTAPAAASAPAGPEIAGPSDNPDDLPF